jgi:hypothetical protein
LHSVVIRTLSRELRLHTGSDEVFATLSFLGADPLMPAGERPSVDLVVEPIGKFYRIEPPGRDSVEGSPDAILNGAFRLLAAWMIKDAHDAPMIHAAIATIGGRRFAFLGDKGFGKTTLMLKLVEERVCVEGDEHALITADGAIPRPRRLHVKESSLAVVPSLSAAIRSSPWITDWMGNRIFACLPSLCGARWEITERPIQHLVFVEPNFGGSSLLSPLSREEAFARLLETAFMPPTLRGRAAARLRMLVLQAACWRLQLGNLDQALWHLRRVARQR